jgi:hypothetical protein
LNDSIITDMPMMYNMLVLHGLHLPNFKKTILLYYGTCMIAYTGKTNCKLVEGEGGCATRLSRGW